MEEIGMRWREAQKKHARAKTNHRGNIIIERMAMFEVDPEMIGECDNISSEDLKKGIPREKVRAADFICSVGIIRRGRNWNDYGGTFCVECPYFIHENFEQVIRFDNNKNNMRVMWKKNKIANKGKSRSK